MLGNLFIVVNDLLKRYFLLLLLLFVSAVMVYIFATKKTYEEISLKFTTVFKPVLVSINYVGYSIDFVGNQISSYLITNEKYQELVKEHAKTLENLHYLENVDQENKDLKKLVNFKDHSNFRFISARILTGASSPFIRSILISAGSNDGVKKGQIAVNDEGVVGRVIEVDNNISRVLLITDPSSKLPIEVKETEDKAIAEGNGMPDSLHVLFFKDNPSYEIDQKEVITSADAEFFPYGLKVGLIRKVSRSEYKIDTAVTWHKLRYISIIDYKN